MRVLALLVIPAMLGATARAGEIPIRGLGAWVTALGDLDGDGKPEFAAATRGAKAEVVVVSSATGNALWRADGHGAAAIPDRDGDGKPDVVLAVRSRDPAGWGAICKGITGARLALIASPGTDVSSYTADGAPFSESVAVVPDANGDGKPDLLVVRAIPADFQAGRGLAALLQPWCAKAGAYVVGLDGKLIADLAAVANPDQRSPVAAPAGDADGDGRSDVFVCVSPERHWLPIELRSLAKGVIVRFKGDAGAPAPDAIAVCGDLDGDKTADFLFGSSSAGRGSSSATGAVRVMSGKDGKEIRVVRGAKEGDRLGQSVAALPDIDGDGVPDFAAGAPGTEPRKSLSLAGAVVACSGKTGKVLWTAKGETASGSLGESLAALGDADGDGVADLVAGAPGFGPDDKGLVVVLSGKTGKTLLSFAGK